MQTKTGTLWIVTDYETTYRYIFDNYDECMHFVTHSCKLDFATPIVAGDIQRTVMMNGITKLVKSGSDKIIACLTVV